MSRLENKEKKVTNSSQIQGVKLGAYIKKCYPKGIQSIIVKPEAVVIYLDKKNLVYFLRFLKTHSVLRFSLLLDIWGVDYPNRSQRFEVNYMLLSLKLNMRVIVKISCNEEEALDSVTEIFNSAGWLEREVWDMYGIYFANNQDLRRILTDYGFDGYPLRKDFPLSGFTEIRYDDGEKRVIHEPIEMTQEFRLFNFTSPWEDKKIK